MEELRQASIKQIIERLDSSFFTQHAFETSFNNRQADEIVRITFREHPDFKFIIKSDPVIDNNWTLTESPGPNFSTPEQSKIERFRDCFTKIDIWISRILEESTSGSSSGPAIFAELRNNLNKMSDELPNPDQPFTQEEATVWIKKLDDLVAEFEHLKEAKKIQQNEINELKKAVQQLKANVENVPKGVWVKAAGNKILNTIEGLSNSQVGQILIEGSIKALLSGE